MPPSRLAIDLAERAVELDVARAFSDAATAYDDAATQLEVESSTADDANVTAEKTVCLPNRAGAKYCAGSAALTNMARQY